jgi:SET domain-containing protein
MIESKKVQVKPSCIEGLGLFSLDPIAAGECIRRISVVRQITPRAPLREDHGERLDHCDYPDGTVVLLGFPDRHVNHCCDPNAYVRYEQEGCYLYARRAIGAGEEITVDYNINITKGTSWLCHCAAARCRGVVAGDFFELPIEIQQEYKPLLAEWFIRRNREALSALDRQA